MQKLKPFIWFDSQAEEAANFYVSIFKNSSIVDITRYIKEAEEVSGKKAGSVMTVTFDLEGQRFIAINGGDAGENFKLNGAISFLIECKDQNEVDHYWNKLSEGGKTMPCGWVADKFGVTWQVAPTQLDELLASPDPEVAGRVMKAMLKMEKIDLAEIVRASEGK